MRCEGEVTECRVQGGASVAASRYGRTLNATTVDGRDAMRLEYVVCEYNA